MTTTRETAHAHDAAADRDEADLDLRAVPSFTRRVRAGEYPDVPDAVRYAAAAGDRLREHTQALYADLPDQTVLAARVLFDLTEGRPITDALEAAVDAHVDRQRRDAAFGVLRLATTGAERHLRDTIRDHLPALMDGLRGRLEACVDQLRTAYTDLGDLDPHAAEPLAIAEATDAQRTAVTTVVHQTREYRRIRGAQRDALVASSLPVIGGDAHTVWTWRHLFATGVHEVKAPGIEGHPGAGLPTRLAVRAVVTRRDVWLPDPVDLERALERLRSAHDEARRQEAQQAAARSAAVDEANRGLNAGNRAYHQAVALNNGGRTR